jgi:hypothetical protein
MRRITSTTVAIPVLLFRYLPRLQAQVPAVCSPQIAGVGGATVTTHGDVSSSQWARDAANFTGARGVR